MLESVSIFTKGGLVLYQYVATPTDGASTATTTTTTTVESTIDLVNLWLEEIYFNPTKSFGTERKVSMDIKTTNDYAKKKQQSITTISGSTKVMIEWEEISNLIAVAIYPDIVRRSQDAFAWIRTLLQATLQEFQFFRETIQQQAQQETENDSSVANENSETNQQSTARKHLFDGTFLVLLKQHKGKSLSKMDSAALSTTKNDNNNNNSNNNNNKNSRSNNNNKGKEKRQWHDGKAKVTKEAMAELDFSKDPSGGDHNIDEDDDVALAEARAAYLPTDADLANYQPIHTTKLNDNADDESSEGSWGSSLKGLFQQVTGQKLLTKQDLEAPLKEMHNMLTSKNVATDIAQQICQKVQEQLLSKRLNSMYRVKTAVRQGLEIVINKLLAPSTQLDLLRMVISKRDNHNGWMGLTRSTASTKKRPFVIVVVGINGVGKSTSLAKLAFYLKSNGCKPLLAACDTFRSGAVEQLSVHAKCLSLPIFHKGYSKDPSSVAKAAIEQAMQDENDVVLVDTAGRMQNNVPLMKALGKLAHENQPDLILFVGEALVGNDGVDQVKMFHQAVSTGGSRHKIDAILLTKFDTVSDKVGAALTMTHVTNAPILFVGTGQKYHHLQKLSTQAVIQSLFR